MFIKGIFFHTIKAAKKDMLFVGSLLLVLSVIAFAFFMGSTAIAEQKEAQMVYAAALGRISVILSSVIFICFHVKRMFENREVEMLLSKSFSRSSVVVSLFCGFVILAIPAILLLSGVIAIISPSKIGALLWTVSFIVESMSIAAFAMFAALMISSPVFSLILTIGVYIMTRIIGSFSVYIDILNSAKELYIFQSFAQFLLKIISIIIPRLDFCAHSEWLVYGMNSANFSLFYYGVAQALIFGFLILAAAIIDFNKKNF